MITTDVVTATPDTHAAELGRLVVERHLRAVPVVDGDRLAGIVRRVDVLRTIRGTTTPSPATCTGTSRQPDGAAGRWQ